MMIEGKNKQKNLVKLYLIFDVRARVRERVSEKLWEQNDKQWSNIFRKIIG